MTLEKWGATTPYGLLRFAQDYHVAAGVLHQSPVIKAYSMPAYSLMGQAIELSLKSFLRARGVPAKELKYTIGHNLSEALSRARAEGLDRRVRRRGIRWSAIDVLSDPYRWHHFRYIVTGSFPLPPWEHLDLAASALITGLFDYAIRASYARSDVPALLRQRARFFSPLKPKSR